MKHSNSPKWDGVTRRRETEEERQERRQLADDVNRPLRELIQKMKEGQK